jgi:dihydroorotase
LKNHSEKSILNFFPIGAVSHSCKGEDITEIIDMHNSGAVAFSDGSQSVESAGLMLRALQYAKAINGLIINHPDEASISPDGQIHEGKVSVSLGLEGIPEMNEILGLKRDLQLQEYAQSRYCAYNISSAESCSIIKKEKRSAPPIFYTVSYLNLLYTHKDLENFNVNLKVKPPLRQTKDKRALINALKDDQIDAITSGHLPLEEEMKKMSFAFASFGATGIETVFSALLSLLDEDVELSRIIEKLTIGPRTILNLPIPLIKEGEDAELCVFDPDLAWEFTKDTMLSKSKNSPFTDQALKGKVLGIINNNKHNLDF